MKVYRTKGGYFYKELKNGKKTRISKEVYNKLRKKQKQTGKGMIGGDGICRMCRGPRVKGCTATKTDIDYYLNYYPDPVLVRYISIGADVKTNRGFFKSNNAISALPVCHACDEKLKGLTGLNMPKLKTDTNALRQGKCIQCKGTGNINENRVNDCGYCLYYGHTCTHQETTVQKVTCSACRGTKNNRTVQVNNIDIYNIIKAKHGRRQKLMRNGVRCQSCNATGQVGTGEFENSFIYNPGGGMTDIEAPGDKIYNNCKQCNGLGYTST